MHIRKPMNSLDAEMQSKLCRSDCFSNTSTIAMHYQITVIMMILVCCTDNLLKLTTKCSDFQAGTVHKEAYLIPPSYLSQWLLYSLLDPIFIRNFNFYAVKWVIVLCPATGCSIHC